LIVAGTDIFCLWCVCLSVSVVVTVHCWRLLLTAIVYYLVCVLLFRETGDSRVWWNFIQSDYDSVQSQY